MNRINKNKKMRKLYRRGGRMKYYANGGMYGNNTVPGSMIPNTNTASYEQVNQAQIDASNQQLAQIKAQPWQQQFAQQQQEGLAATQALNQSATKGLGMLTDRLSEGKNVFGQNAQQLATSQGFTDTIVDGVVTETAASKAGNLAGNVGTAGMVADFAVQGLQKVSDDGDATKMNVGETTGTMLSGAGKGASMGATIGSIVPGVGTAIGAGVGATIGAVTSGLKGRKARNEAREMEEEEEMKKAQAEQGAFAGALQGKEYSGSNMGQLKRGGYRNFYMGGGPLNYANGGNVRKFIGGGYDFSSTPDGKRIEPQNSSSNGRLALDVAGMFNPLAGFAAGALDANDARKYYKEGDYGAAAKSAGMAALGFIPWGGSWAKGGIKGLSKLAKTPIKPLINTGAPMKALTTGTKTGLKSGLKTNKHMAKNQNPMVVPPSGPSQTGPVADPNDMMMLGYRHGGVKKYENGGNSTNPPAFPTATQGMKQVYNKELGRMQFVSDPSAAQAPTMDYNAPTEMMNQKQLDEQDDWRTSSAAFSHAYIPQYATEPVYIDKDNKIMPNKQENMSHAQKVMNQDNWWQRGSMNPLGYINAYDDVETRLGAVADGMDAISAAPIPILSQMAGVTGGLARIGEGAAAGDRSIIGQGIANTGISSIPGASSIVKAPGQFLAKHTLKQGTKKVGIPTALAVTNRRMGGARQLDGGVAKPLPGGATEFIGKKHEQGGIKLDPMTEVEGGETMDKIQGSDYFFSSYLKLGGKSFAQRHKDILKQGGSQAELDRLAAIQEKAAGRSKYNLGGERTKFQTGGPELTAEEQAKLQEYIKSLGKEANSSSVLDNATKIPAELANINPALFNLKGFSIEDLQNSASTLGLSLTEAANFMLTPKGYSFIKGVSEEEANIIIGNANFATNNSSSNENIINKSQNVVIDNNNLNNAPDKKKKSTFTGLYNNVTDADIADYLDEAAAITGLDTFDPRNKEHVKLLQTNLMNPSEELKTSYPTYFSGKETDILEGDLGVNQQGVDSKFGIDTLNALKQFSELESNNGSIYDVLPGEYDPNIYTFNPELDATITKDPNDEYQYYEPENEPIVPPVSEENEKNKGGDLLKKLGKSAVPILGAGLQLLPAYMAFKEKPDYMNAPGRLPTTHLDRVRFNAEREQNEGNYRGMGRMIEQAGMGPAGIAAKMASWGKKQAQDVQIGSAEARANAQIQQQESALNQGAQKQNIANSMQVDQFNKAADAATKDRKLMAVQNAVQSIAGMGSDYMQYKAQNDLSRAIAGQTPILDNFYTHELAFQKANPDMANKQGSPEYNGAYLSYLKQVQNPTKRRGGYRELYKRGGRKKLKKC
jgi:hypothetical protein